ncbi:integrase [Loktanella ponticola]|uniref:Integrase n=1 Tax=Yoonia ponticola TaxID=1524255 RepID=A0A7W9BKU0_9RHOB|nr:tyrosine-type recombinase/integrase [Yoonia ponticola]MBB5722376.1 integrase [Yoonia ponticola]
MAVKSNRSERLLQLKGNVFWYRQGVPKAVHKLIGGPKFLTINLLTSDVARAKSKRDEIEAVTRVQFRDIEAGRRVELELLGQPLGKQRDRLSPTERGVVTREAWIDAKDNGDEEELSLIIDAAEAEASSLRPARRKAFEDAMLGRVRADYHVDAYLSTAGLTSKTASERQGLIRMFADWCERSKQSLADVDRRLAGRYMNAVLDDLHPATQRKRLTALRQYWIYLARRGHVSLPVGEAMTSGWPWNDQRVVKRATRVERGAKPQRERSFTDAEIGKLLNTTFPLASDWEDLMKDALLVSLYSGMRQGEIMTLWVEEVVFSDGKMLFDIQQGKTEAAARKVPVHSELVDIIKRRTLGKGPQSLVFHELTGSQNPPDKYGKRFKRWREAVGVSDMQANTRRSLVNFHSARRWFTTKARHAGVSKETIGDVVGHKPDKRDITFGVYTQGASVEQLVACVEAVRLTTTSKS